MAVALKHVHRNTKTGLLSYRRAYPIELRPYIPNNRIQLKRSLGAHRLEDVGAMTRYQSAHSEFEATVANSRKKLEGRYDALTAPLIAFIAKTFEQEWLAADDAMRVSGNSYGLILQRRGLDEHLDSFRGWRAKGDLGEIVEWWQGDAIRLLDAHNILLDPQDPDRLDALCFALNGAAIRVGKECLERLKDAGTIETPEAPQRPSTALVEPLTAPSTGLSFDAIARIYMDGERNPVAETSKEVIRTALKFFKQVHGEPLPEAINAAAVNEWLDLLAKRPSNFLRPSDGELPLRALRDLYRDRPEIARMSPKTQERYVGALSQCWKQSQNTGSISRTLSNPFLGHKFKSSPRSTATKGYRTDELQAIFNLPIFHGERITGPYADACYWLPLMLRIPRSSCAVFQFDRAQRSEMMVRTVPI